MKVALVHDDLVQFGGAEELFVSITKIWPKAAIYTSMASPEWIKRLAHRHVVTSFMQSLPLKGSLYRQYFPLYPLAFESFDFSEFDLVVSSSTRFAHGIITKPQTLHISYMNTPPRMFWDSRHYFNSALLNTALSPLLSYLRVWDNVAATRPDVLVANSKTPQARIRKYYGKDVSIIYPFVDTSKFKRPATGKSGDYYLLISRLNAWKRIDIAIAAANKLKERLVIIGDGPDRRRLARMAGPTVELVGRRDFSEVLDYLTNCQAVVHPQEEDFGLVPVEAMAMGKPVLAFGSGGALETVIPGKTGEFFTPQTSGALSTAWETFDPKRFDANACRDQASKFSKERFVREIKSLVASYTK